MKASTMKILLVDDDDELREALCETLAIAGHQVTSAKGGNEARALMRRVDVDILVTDILMPERDGLEVIKEFHQLRPKAAIVAMSGGSGGVRGHLCLDLASCFGATVVLRKPFMPPDLRRAVEEAAELEPLSGCLAQG